MYKQHSLVMLPSNNKSNLILIGMWKRLHKDEHSNITKLAKDESFQHLYIVSDEEIKEGDNWMYVDLQGVALFPTTNATGSQSDDLDKKIIATTDKLIIGWDYNKDIPQGDFYNKFIPTIPQSFITHFINEYNKGNVINKVMVEYFDSTGGFAHIQNIKLNSDNTINIKPCKDSYTREEVIALFNLYFTTQGKGEYESMPFEQWSKQNF